MMEVEHNPRLEAALRTYPGQAGFETHAPVHEFYRTFGGHELPVALSPFADALNAVIKGDRSMTRFVSEMANYVAPPLSLAEMIYDDLFEHLIKGKADEPFREKMTELIEKHATEPYDNLKDKVGDAVDAVKQGKFKRAAKLITP
jgi:hypothetical protein